MCYFVKQVYFCLSVYSLQGMGESKTTWKRMGCWCWHHSSKKLLRRFRFPCWPEFWTGDIISLCDMTSYTQLHIRRLWTKLSNAWVMSMTSNSRVHNQINVYLNLSSTFMHITWCIYMKLTYMYVCYFFRMFFCMFVSFHPSV